MVNAGNAAQRISTRAVAILVFLLAVGLVGMHMSVLSEPSATSEQASMLSSSDVAMGGGHDGEHPAGALACGIPGGHLGVDGCGMSVAGGNALIASPRTAELAVLSLPRPISVAPPSGLAPPRTPDLVALSISRT